MSGKREWRVEVVGFGLLGAHGVPGGWDYASREDAEREAARYTAEYGTEARAVKI